MLLLFWPRSEFESLPKMLSMNKRHLMSLPKGRLIKIISFVMQQGRWMKAIQMIANDNVLCIAFFETVIFHLLSSCTLRKSRWLKRENIKSQADFLHHVSSGGKNIERCRAEQKLWKISKHVVKGFRLPCMHKTVHRQMYVVINYLTLALYIHTMCSRHCKFLMDS